MQLGLAGTHRDEGSIDDAVGTPAPLWRSLDALAKHLPALQRASGAAFPQPRGEA